MKNKINKPAFRNNFRMTLGRLYFTVKRYFEWCFDGKLYAINKVQNERLEYKIFISQSPLRRALKNIDEYLNENKITNLKIAIEQINGIILKPQEVFSYWKLIGKPTKSKGYKEGFVLHNGKIAKEIGGGLCQLSNLIYWITLHTPLTITERWRHNYDVFPDTGRDRPFASGATCSFNYVDLQIKNTTQNTYQLILKLENDHLVGEIFH